jgi:hypothetical protein
MNAHDYPDLERSSVNFYGPANVRPRDALNVHVTTYLVRYAVNT